VFRHILVPIDGSKPSLAAVRHAARLAREQKARLTAFWVAPNWEPNLYAYEGHVPGGFVSPSQHKAHVRDAARRRYAAAKKAAAAEGSACRFQYVEGSVPYLEIVKAAGKNRCDLIVMASHSSGLFRLLLGSQTNKVLAHAAVPVIVCR
jgi:nucleotide-binding universal stress UspA family protein